MTGHTEAIEQLVEEPTSQQGSTMSRRKFLTMSWRTAGALMLGMGGYHGARYLSSTQERGVFGQVVTAGRLRDFPPDSVTYFEAARFFLVRMADGGFLALYSKCTHLACVVSWDADAGQFFCPCHGSQFETNGDVLNPPAVRPLDRFPVLIEGERVQRVKVDTGQRIEQDAPTADVLVYAEE
jgi:cytochrome b6-f complex iron-sulfur subunit